MRISAKQMLQPRPVTIPILERRGNDLSNRKSVANTLSKKPASIAKNRSVYEPSRRRSASS